MSEIHAQSIDQGKLQEITNQIKEYEVQIQKLSSQANTLSNQISQYDFQIKLTELKIKDTGEKIALLGGRIDQLETSLEALSKAFSQRVKYSYKMSRLHESLVMLLTAPDLATIFSNYQYLQRIQKSDRDLLVRLKSAQVDYKDQKKGEEDLQKELKNQEAVLASQKAAKKNLLDKTKNDEKKYQELLDAAKSEYEAIQAITAGKGQEVSVGHVNKGDKIALIISVASCNSSGPHLHFIVSQNSVTQNPFTYLKLGITAQNCSGSSCGSGDGDPFNPSGNWDWPIAGPIVFSQGYGSTWATRNTWVGKVYNFHNGIDIFNPGNLEVHAVISGTLFRGSYGGVNGCRLRYVRVDHDDSNLDTFYLHINY